MKTYKLNKDSVFYIPFYFLKQYIFWILFFALNRLVFFLYNFSASKSAGLSEVLKSFWNAIYLDTSMASYILIIPFLILFFQSFIRKNFFNKINIFYTFFIALIVSLTYIGELGIYNDWHEKLSFKAIAFLVRPDEVINTAGPKLLIIGFLLLTLLFSSAIILYKKLFHENIKIIKRNFIFSTIWFLLMPGILLLGMRGGLQEIPISSSIVYFSKSNHINIGTVNTPWNLIFSILNNQKFQDKNPFEFYSYEEANKIVDSLYFVEKDTTELILTVEQPNIVIIMLESWSADAIEVLGGYKGITPNFNKLSKEGILFTEHRSNGMLSHQAVVAIYSSFPSTPETSIIQHSDKYEKLSFLTKKLKNYNSSFYFGGHLHYGNIKSYLYYSEFDKIHEVYDFPDDAIRGNMGVHDESLFKKIISDSKDFKEPFLCGAFTLSSHSPFDFPMETVINWGDEYQKYLNSIYYTDKCLGEFIENAKKQDWYDNTLFIFLADHSHPSPKNWWYYSPDIRRVPMLFFGNVLKEKYKGYKFNKNSSQVDLAATLLAQLKIKHDDFKYSRNLFNPYTNIFSIYGFDDGFGFVSPDGYIVYDKFNDAGIIKFEGNKKIKDSLEKSGKAYLQVLYNDFLKF